MNRFLRISILVTIVSFLSIATIVHAKEPTRRSYSNLIWSPNGKEVAFLHHPSLSTNESNVMLANSDGTNIRRLTKGSFDKYLSWSPDSSLLTFVRNDRDTIIIDRTGKPFFIIPPLKGCETRDDAPRWSPDGTKIIYFAYCPGSDNSFRSLIFDLQSKESKLLMVEVIGETWSPDGRWITFFKNLPSPDRDEMQCFLFYMRPDGSGIRKVLYTGHTYEGWQTLPYRQTVSWSTNGEFAYIAGKFYRTKDWTTIDVPLKWIRHANVTWSPDSSLFVTNENSYNESPYWSQNSYLAISGMQGQPSDHCYGDECRVFRVPWWNIEQGDRTYWGVYTRNLQWSTDGKYVSFDFKLDRESTSNWLFTYQGENGEIAWYEGYQIILMDTHGKFIEFPFVDWQP